ncbi:MAG: PIG-L family deacetylase [Holophagales bacterium]|nr:PIG-L family deacetylase [Holophagales bacterium]
MSHRSERYDAIYLSPHLDDAILSCGAQIHRRAARGERVMVLTVFTADVPDGALSDLAVRVLLWMGLRRERAMAVRRDEDLRACEGVGAEAVHWPFAEATFRRRTVPGSEGPEPGDEELGGDELYVTARQLFARPVEADIPFIEELASAFERLPPADGVFSPLAVGSHADHHVVRSAAEHAFGNHLAYYEDFPYVRKFRALGKALGRRREWRGLAVEVEEVNIRARLRAIREYGSQITPLFGDERRMEKAVRRYSQKVGGERLWYPRLDS